MTTPERRALLTAALGFAQIQWHGETPMPARALHAYLDTWRGVGDVMVGMLRQDFEVTLGGGPDGWSASFFSRRSGGGAPEIIGTGHDQAPWQAVQLAASTALRDDRLRAEPCEIEWLRDDVPGARSQCVSRDLEIDHSGDHDDGRGIPRARHGRRARRRRSGWARG